MPLVKHKFTSQKADGTDSTFVKPSDWNATHNLTQTTKAVLGALAAGDTVELPLVGSTGADDGTIWTKQAIIDAIAAAVGGFIGFTTGDVIASVLYSKPGFLQLNGQTIGNVGSGATFANASAHDLFVMFWSNINGVSWPIVPSRGTSAEADWAAGNTLALPDARGRVLGMVDENAGVNTLLDFIGSGHGEQDHVLNQGEMPAHQHGVQLPYGAFFGAGSGGYVGGGSLGTSNPAVATGVTGGDGIFPPSGLGEAHNNVQPTLGIVYHIKL